MKASIMLIALLLFPTRPDSPSLRLLECPPQHLLPFAAVMLVGNGKGMAYPHGSGVGVHAGRGTGTAADTRGILNTPKNVPNGHVLAEILIEQ